MNDWQPIETAPKDGTPIIAWCVHSHAHYSEHPVDEGWVAPVITRWIDFNGGGWTWHGLCGTFTHWMPLPSPPKTPDEPLDGYDQALIDAAWNKHATAICDRGRNKCNHADAAYCCGGGVGRDGKPENCDCRICHPSKIKGDDHEG